MNITPLLINSKLCFLYHMYIVMAYKQTEEERIILEQCCEENNVDVDEIYKLLEAEDQYSTSRVWITNKLKQLIEDSVEE